MKKSYKLTGLVLLGAISVTMITKPLLSHSNRGKNKVFKHLAKTWQDAVDTNQDKMLSEVEFKKYLEKVAEERWKKLVEKLDSNKDGLLSQNELEKIRELKKERRKKGRKHRKGRKDKKHSNEKEMDKPIEE